MYFRLGKLQRVYTYVQQMWGSPVGTDGAPPQNDYFFLEQATKS
jgi:hypothetical protein